MQMHACCRVICFNALIAMSLTGCVANAPECSDPDWARVMTGVLTAGGSELLRAAVLDCPTRSDRSASAGATSRLPAPVVGPESREALAASFDQRRREIEAKWDAQIKTIKRLHCQMYGASPPGCDQIVKAAEAERDAELQTLNEARARAMTAAATAPAPTAPVTAAEFDLQRKAIEAKWEEKISQWRQSLCNFNGGSGSMPCNVKMAELAEQRDAELKAFDEARAKAMIAPVTIPNEAALAPPAVQVKRRLEVRGPDACTIIGQPAGAADYQAVREELDQCWQARIAVAQGLCDKSLGAAGPPCYAANDARKYRDAALATFDAGWKQRTAT